MSRYTATVKWLNSGPDFLRNNYTRAHQWEFDGGCNIPASASPDIVATPWSVAENVDPEEAFVASLASCHMLFFLHLASIQGYVVDSYCDAAEGFMAKNGDGKIAMTKVVLHPRLTFSGERMPDNSEITRLHHLAHEKCYIANSVTTRIEID